MGGGFIQARPISRSKSSNGFNLNPMTKDVFLNLKKKADDKLDTQRSLIELGKAWK